MQLSNLSISSVRCGSVIVDLVLRFNQNLTESEVITTLKTAAAKNKFGSFNVDPNSIKSAPCSTTPSTPTSTEETQGIVKVLCHIYFCLFDSKEVLTAE